MEQQKLNGSAALLIEGLQGVIKETVEEGIKPVIDAMADMEGRLIEKIDGVEKRLDERIDTTNKNVQSQIAAFREEMRP